MLASVDRALLPSIVPPVAERHAATVDGPVAFNPEPRLRGLLASGDARSAQEMLLTLTPAQQGEPRFRLLAVEIQIYLGDWDTALSLLRRFFADSPRCPALYGMRTAMWDMIADGRARETQQSLVARALDHEASGRWIDAIDLWMRLRASSADPREATIAIGRSLSRLGDREAAEMTLGHLSRTNPDDLEVLAEYAQLPGRYDDWEESASRWTLLFKRHPDAVFFVAPATEAYWRSNRLAQARELIEHALATSPDDLHVIIAAALAAEQNENWDLAAQAWRKTLAIDPGNVTVKELLGRAVWNQTLTDPTQASGTAADTASVEQKQSAAEPEFEAILSVFENLTDNCEVGLIQRHYGAEPVSLFRFSATTPERMIELLDLKFAPLGDPAHTIVRDHDSEYMLVDDRGYFTMHTMIPKDQSSPEKILRQQGARISILRRKLLSDLASGKKIFVCKTSESPIPEATLTLVSNALRRHGDNFLLGIRVADAEHPAGTLSVGTEPVAIGYVAHMFGHGLDPIDYDNWRVILEKTYRHWSSLQRAA